MPITIETSDTYPFSPQFITKMISGSSAEEPLIIQQATGPGEITKWDFLDLREETNCFIEQPTKRARVKKKILLCDKLSYPLYGFGSEDLRFISALLAHPDYEVYLFEGRDQNLLDAVPITDLKKFFERWHTIQPATAAQIKTLLAAQQISSKDWYPLDFLPHHQLWTNPPTELCFNATSKFDLRNPEHLQLVIDSTDGTYFTSIVMGEVPGDTLKRILKHFKQLTHIQFNSISSRWLEEHISYFADSNIKSIYINSPRCPNNQLILSLHKNYGIEEIVFEVNVSCHLADIYSAEDLNIHFSLNEPDRLKLSPKCKKIEEEQCRRFAPKILDSRATSSTDRIEPEVISSWTQYQALFTSGQNKKIEALEIVLDHPEFLAKISKNPYVAKDFPQLKWLKISKKTYSRTNISGILRIEHPLLEYFAMKNVQCAMKNLPKLNEIQTHSDWCDWNHQQLPSLRLANNELTEDFIAIAPTINPHSTTATAILSVPTAISDRKRTPPGGHPPPSFPDFSFFDPMAAAIPHKPDGKLGIRYWDEQPNDRQLCYSVRENDTAIPPGRYRITCYNSLDWQPDGQLAFLPVTAPRDDHHYRQFMAKPWNKRLPTMPGMGSGTLSGTLTVGQEGVPLGLSGPALPVGFVVYTDLGEAAKDFTVGVAYDAGSKQFFARLLPLTSSPSATKVLVKLYYEFTPDTYEAYSAAKPYQPVLLKQSLLPKALLKKILDKIVVKDKFLQDILNLNTPKIPLIDRIHTLVARVLSFKDEPLQLSDPRQMPEKGTDDMLWACWDNSCGVCGQRSQILLTLLWAMGVKAQMVRNRNHALIEIPLADTGKFIRVDLGGGKIEYVHSRARTVSTTAAPLYSTPTIPDIKNPYQEIIRSLGQPSIFKWEDLATAADAGLTLRKPILFRTPPGMTLTDIRKQHFPAGFRGKYLFIDRPEDFDHYGETTAVTTTGRIKGHSPLLEILAEGGTLLINWENFTPAQREIYQKNLLTTPPRLGEYPIISRALNVLGFLPADKPCSASFSNQARICALPPAVVSEAPIQAQPAAELTDHYDLFASGSWYQKLVEDVVFKKGATREMILGPLLRAIKMGRSLVIHRPPQDPRFKRLIDQIKLEGRFFHNGSWVEVPKDIVIESVEKPLQEMPKIIPFRTLQAKQESKAPRRYLTPYNWYLLFEQTIVDIDQHPLTVPGYLAEQTRTDNIVFYVTEEISQAQWEQLAAEITQKFPHLALPLSDRSFSPFTFQLAPGVTPPSFWSKEVLRVVEEKKSAPITLTDLPAFLIANRSGVLTCDDADFLVENLQKQCPASTKPLIIDLTSESNVQELLVSITPVKDADKQRLKIEEKLILTALREGRTIILNGPIYSQRLLQTLLPALDPKHPYLEFNGKQVPIKGRLLIVQPKKAATELPECLTVTDCTISEKDYQPALLTRTAGTLESAREVEIVDKLMQLVKLAPWPHYGTTMPPDVGLRFNRLCYMRETLLAQTPTNTRHNPIKDLWLGDYQKGSEEYAFLNVLCKFQFDFSPKDSVRVEKLNNLLQKKNVSIWELLNTFNGTSLRELFHKDWLVKRLSAPLPAGGLIQIWQQQRPEDQRRVIDKIIAKAEQLIRAGVTAEIPDAKQLLDKSQRKTDERIHASIRAKTKPPLTIQKGVPGAGKSHMLEAIRKNPPENIEVYIGLDAVERWLEPAITPGKIKLLELDEINTAKPGSLNWLKGINRGVVVYKGKEYRIGPEHRLLCAMNPNNYPGRHMHDVLRYSNTILRQMPSLPTLQYWLETQHKLSPEVATQFLQGAELYKNIQPVQGYSFRNLQNLVQRYRMLCEKQAENPSPGKSSTELIYDALRGEFARVIPFPAEQEIYKKRLSETLGIPLPAATSFREGRRVGDKLFPSEMLDAHDAVQEALWIRQRCMQRDRDAKEAGSAALAYKHCLILQGESGIGKTLLCKQLLKAAELSALSYQQFLDIRAGKRSDIDLSKHYLEVSASDPQFRDFTNFAYKHGMVLIVKNMNFLSEEDDVFLANLAETAQSESSKSGFFILGIKPSDGTEDSASLSPALCNRSQILHVPTFAEASLRLLAQQRMPDPHEAHALTQAFLREKSLHKGLGFFDILEKVTEAPNKPSKRRREEPKEVVGHQLKVAAVSTPSLPSG